MHKLHVLVAHNSYQMRGGEDAVVDAEVALLRAHGHKVTEYRRHNDELQGMGALNAAMDTLWSRRTSRDMDVLMAAARPDIVHVHNTFPLISPSLYWAAHRHRVPVVQTLHNFRLLCPQAMFLREGKVCEDCLGQVPWRAVQHACYRESRAQSAALGSMLIAHRLAGTWQHRVARYIALNEFCRNKFIEGGLPAERIAIKPNFTDFEAAAARPRSGFLFVGRLSPEKGIDVLAGAARQSRGLQIRVAGTGPSRDTLDGIPAMQELGALSAGQVREEMGGASALLLPSVCYENFPRTLVEAFACGLPVIASRIGALAELVDDGVTGLLFEPGSAEHLLTKLRWAQSHGEEMNAMGQRARLHYERNFTPEINYGQLMAIYGDVQQWRSPATDLLTDKP